MELSMIEESMAKPVSFWLLQKKNRCIMILSITN